MKYNKSIIIDFDNTIGHFRQFIFILNIIENVYNRKPLEQKEIHILLDKFPLYFRPFIFEFFNIIIHNKNINNVNLLILYSCNDNEYFVKTIINYIILKCKINLFDYVIFNKINKKSIEEIRKICENNIKDNELFLCVDDKKHSNIKLKYYFLCLKYYYFYDLKEIINNFPYDNFDKINKKIIKKYFKNRKKTDEEDNQLPLYCYKLDTHNLIIYLTHEFLIL